MNRSTLLIVDDAVFSRAVLRSLFEAEYILLEAVNGEQALMLLNQYHSTIAAVLLDIVMPGKDGYQVMREMGAKGLLNKIPVIVITAQNSTEKEIRAFDLGASDMIVKPFDHNVVKRRVHNIVELNRHQQHLEELVEEHTIRLRESKEALLDALTSVIEHRNVESGQHVLRIRMFTKVLLEDVMRSYPEYDLDERSIGLIASASALHDIGKIAIPDSVLKKPGPLTVEEFELMKTHSAKGCEILASLDRMQDEEYLRYGYNICRYHHERWDGGGYPEGLVGENIPIYAQAVGITDAFDALTTDRVYKKAFSPEKSYNMILNGECGAFSPRLLESFKNVREHFVALLNGGADATLPKEASSGGPALAVSERSKVSNTLELGQMKYFALLRYVSATVLEIDIDSGIYHIVYQHSSDFDALRSDTSFWESLRAFANSSVHQEDAPMVRETSERYIHDFLEKGYMKQARKYRVLHRESGDYLWYEATALRIYVDDPRQHKVLIVWKELAQPPAPTGVTVRPPEEFSILQGLSIGVQQCLNDQWFTILHLNNGFVTLFGYSKEEIKRRFQDRFVEMIYPEDRLWVEHQFRTQASHNSSLELEYRLQTKDGRILWILDKCQHTVAPDGTEYLNCALIDVTQFKQEQEKLRLTMERHQIIMDQTNDIIFEWDIEKDTLSFSTNWAMKFGYEPIATQISSRIPFASHILPEDVPKFVTIMKQVLTGMPYGETELRIANAEGRYLWFRIRATTQFDAAGRAIKAVGVILDIDREQRRAQDLIDRADRDTLTHLYNKNASRRKIQQILDASDGRTMAVMLLVDLDNFKLVNDTRGHMFGDAVLVEVATQLQKLFRGEDIVARIGGDEYLVFVRTLPSQTAAEERATRVVDTLRNVFAENLQDCCLSCSVGVAYFPEHGTNYPDLFQKCDQALYRAKAQGKNRFVLYDRATMAKTFGLNPEQMAANTRIDSDDIPSDETNGIVQAAFRELYEAGDVELAVNSILKMVGSKYNVSRAYIFENSEDGSFCCNTFEWCNEGVRTEIASLRHVAYGDLGDSYQENFDESGIFYCPNIQTLSLEQRNVLQPQGIQSMLQCAIRDDGKFVGYVGFDDCSVRRMWTQSQIDALHFVSELLSTFLLKKRAQDRAVETAKDLRMVLDSQNSWIYAIDPETYALLYINEKTHTIAPEARLDMCCYEAFFKRTSPCTHCPAQDIRSKGNQTMEVYNPVLHVWAMADASFIRWGGQDACLLACHDITPYKALAVEE